MPNDGEGAANFVYVYWKDILPWLVSDCPVLLLDATLPEELVKIDYPQAQVIDLQVDVPNAFVR